MGVIYSTPKHCYTRLLTVRGTGDTENPLEMHVWSKCSLDRNEIKSLPKHVAKSEFLEMNKKQFLCECTCCLWRILKEKFQNLPRSLVRVTQKPVPGWFGDSYTSLCCQSAHKIITISQTSICVIQRLVIERWLTPSNENQNELDENLSRTLVQIVYKHSKSSRVKLIPAFSVPQEPAHFYDTRDAFWSEIL